MTTFTLDFSGSYRAITDADVTPIMDRDIFGFDGKGEPEAAVTLVANDGTTTILPASNGWSFLHDPYLYSHSPTTSRMDMVVVGDPNKPVLRFDVAVDPAPLWGDYVKAKYVGQAESLQYFTDYGNYQDALTQW